MVSCTPAFFKTNSQLLSHFVGQPAKSHLNDPKSHPQEGLKMVPTEQGQYLEVSCTATCQCPIEYLWQHPRQGLSVYEVTLAGAHKLWSK